MLDNKKNIFSIRGATTIKANLAEEIFSASKELIDRIISVNNIDKNSIVNIIISSTEDVTAAYPAKAVREQGLSDVPIFSCLEPDIDGALPFCIRFLITVVSFVDGFKPKHIYLHEAKSLRPDLAAE